MFDIMKVAKRIKEARIAKNMTQMNLADAMGVSYQAVSNWERGNSMPDISKLEDLCGVLDISVSMLLGMDHQETATVEKALKQEDLTVEELTDIAPMLPPAQVEAQAKKSGGKKWNVAALSGIAPFLDETFLEEIVNDVEVESLEELCGLAPFLGEDALDKLVRKAPRADAAGIISLAPFLSEDTLDYLAKRSEGDLDWPMLSSLAPFLGEDALDALVRKVPQWDTAGIVCLAPFLGEETLDWMVRLCDEKINAPLLGDLAPFLSEESIDALVDSQIAKGNAAKLSSLYPFMGDETLRKVAKALMAEGNLDALRAAAPFL